MSDRKKYPYYYRLGLSLVLSMMAFISIDFLALAIAFSTRAQSSGFSIRYDDFQLFLDGRSVGIDAFSYSGLALMILLTGIFYSLLYRRRPTRDNSPFITKRPLTDSTAPDNSISRS